MAERLLRIKQETCGPFSDILEMQIDVLKYKNEAYYARCIRKYIGGSKDVSKKPLTPESIMLIFELLSAIKVDAFPKHLRGCDGGFTEIEVGGYDGSAKFRWWSQPPESWQEMDDVAYKIIELCRIDIGL